MIAARIAERLGIPHIPYTVIWDEGLPYSVCEDFVTPDTELIPAWRVMQTQKKDNQTSVYRHYRNCCEKLGIPNVARALDQMLVLDYLIANFAGAEEFIDQERVEAIVSSVNRRIQMLEDFLLNQQPQADSTENDVERNVAAE